MPRKDGTGPDGNGPKNGNCPNGNRSPQRRRDGSGQGQRRNRKGQ